MSNAHEFEVDGAALDKARSTLGRYPGVDPFDAASDIPPDIRANLAACRALLDSRLRPAISAQFARSYVPTLAIGNGWLRIIIELREQMAAIRSDNRFVLIRERAGNLELRIEETSDVATNALVSEAVHRAAMTCCVCGLPGKLRGYDGAAESLRVLCSVHYRGACE